VAIWVKHHSLLRLVLAFDLQVVDETPVNAGCDYLALLLEEASVLNQSIFERQLIDQPQVLIEDKELEVSAESKVELHMIARVLHGNDGSRAGRRFLCSCQSQRS
jgi:hypothetical protein